MLERRVSNVAYLAGTMLIVFAYAWCFAQSTGLV